MSLVPASSHGGSSSSVAVRGPFGFSFDTPDLTNGVVFYTPAVDEILLNVWVEIVHAWDGTTPIVDVGNFLNGDPYGMFYGVTGLSGIPLDGGADTHVDGGGAGGLLVGTVISDLASLGGADSIVQMAQTQAGANPTTILWHAWNGGLRTVPGRFTTDDPLKVVVSQDGTLGGADPGASQGTAKVYIVTASLTAL